MTAPSRSSRTGSRIAAVVAALAALALVAGLPLASADDAPAPAGWVTQIGTFDYLVQPDYDGLAPVSDGIRGATIGLGTSIASTVSSS